jgi:mannose-6-phosphate isomerase-like protein (cupin superfamily)
MENVVTLADIEPKEIPLKEGHHGGRIWYIFNKENIGTEGLRLHVQEYFPGGYTEDHPPHPHIEQVYYVISGTMAVHVDGKDFAAGPGYFVYIPRGAVHYHRNEGADNLKFLTINVPVRSGEVPPLPQRG